jgi:hypothetical protein
VEVWRQLERMAGHAATLPNGGEITSQIEAIRTNRLLLAATDPLSELRVRVGTALRDAARTAADTHERERRLALQTLEASEAWPKLKTTDRDAIVQECQLGALATDDLSSDESLIDSLDRLPIARRRAETDAIRSRATRALALAAQKLEPKVRPVAIERTTLRTKDDVIAWSERQKSMLIEALSEGPVLID